MKKIKFFALLLCAFSMVAFTSCEKDEDDNAVNQNQDNNGGREQDLLLGSWEGDFAFSMGDEEKGDAETLHVVLTINADGVGTMSTSYMSFPLTANMTWVRNGDDILFSIDLSAFAQIGLGVEQLPARIKSLTETQLVLIMYPGEEEEEETIWTRTA